MATSFEPVNGQLKAQFSDFELELTLGELIREGRRIRLQGQPSLWASCLAVMYSHSLGLYASAVSQCPASSRTTISNQLDQSKRP